MSLTRVQVGVLRNLLNHIVACMNKTLTGFPLGPQQQPTVYILLENVNITCLKFPLGKCEKKRTHPCLKRGDIKKKKRATSSIFFFDTKTNKQSKTKLFGGLIHSSSAPTVPLFFLKQAHL